MQVECQSVSKMNMFLLSLKNKMHKCQTTQWKFFFNIKSHILISLWFCTSLLALLLNWVKALGLFCFENEDKISWLLFWHFIINFFSWFEISAHLISFSLCFSLFSSVCSCLAGLQCQWWAGIFKEHGGALQSFHITTDPISPENVSSVTLWAGHKTAAVQCRNIRTRRYKLDHITTFGYFLFS